MSGIGLVPDLVSVVTVYSAQCTRLREAGVTGKRTGRHEGSPLAVSELTDEMPIPDYTNLAPGDRLARALLLFYDAGTWNARAQREWKALTGLDDATTKDLGDLARSVIEQGQRYLIWSDEHHGWWKSTRRGY